MGLLRLVALVAFILAAVGAFGFANDWTLSTVVGWIAIGLAALTASFLEIPQPPPSR